MISRIFCGVVYASLILCVVGCGSATDAEIATMARGEGRNREDAAGSLAERVANGNLSLDQQNRVGDSLRSVLRKWREESGKIYYAELDLAWTLALSSDMASNDRLALLRLLDPVSRTFKSSRTPELRVAGDRATGAPPGFIALHESRVVTVDDEVTSADGIDVVICSRNNGGITWGFEQRMSLPTLPVNSLAVEVKTSWYQLPAGSVTNYPSGSHKPDDIRQWRELVATKGAKILLGETRTLTLSNKKEGDTQFAERTANQTGGR